MGQALTPNDARWTDKDSEHFIDYGNFYVPDREVQIETILSLIPPVVGIQGHLIDLCCGQGLLSRALLKRFDQSIVHGLDGSATMLTHAKTMSQEFGDRFQTQLIELSSSEWRRFPWPLHAVVSSLAIHHLDDLQKELLYRDIAAGLSPGGVFLIADLVRPQTQFGIDVAAKAWDEAVRQRSLELQGDLKAYEFFLEDKWNYYAFPDPEIDKPSALYDQLKWLEKAGLTEIDVFG